MGDLEDSWSFEFEWEFELEWEGFRVRVWSWSSSGRKGAGYNSCKVRKVRKVLRLKARPRKPVGGEIALEARLNRRQPLSA
jgi:hypothetical protein